MARLSRRRFLTASAASALAFTCIPGRVFGANERKGWSLQRPRT